jgi:Uma2 family endonuclease
MNAPRRDVMTEDEYLAAERIAADKHEYINGVVYAMAGGSQRQSLICASLIIALGTRLRGRPCRVHTSDLRIHIPATGMYTYPDVTVVCGRPETHGKDPETVVNPTVILEVLSASTESYDRGAKASHYRTIPSLKAYALVAQDRRHVELVERIDDRWVITDVTEVLAIGALGVDIPLDEIYAQADEAAADR